MNGDQDKREHGLAAVAPEDAGSQALAEALRSSFGLIKLVMVLLVIAFFVRGFFTVGPQERAIILRFGRPVGEGEKALLGPGLHWSFPYPIDEVNHVPITEIQRVESTTGWYAASPEQLVDPRLLPPAGPSLRPGADGYVLTADQNIVHTSATLSYRINDPIRFLFDYVSATNVIRDALDNALIYSAARFKVDDLLRSDRAGFQEAVRKRVTELLDAQQVGVVVDQCNVQSTWPRYLDGAFNSVLQAELTRSKVLEQAHSDENQVLSQASAEAISLTNAAVSVRARLIKDAQSDAQRFNDLLPKYRENPGLFVQQRLTEAISQVLTNAQDKFYLPDRADGKARELRLLLNREPLVPKTESSGK